MQDIVSGVQKSPPAPEAPDVASAQFASGLGDELISERLLEARVAALFDVARPAYFATLANGAILLVVLWGSFTAPILLAWFGVLLAVTLARLALHWRYAGSGSALPPARHREARFAIGALAAGAVWTYAAMVFFPASDPLLQMAVVFVVGGSIIGAAGVYAPSPMSYYAFSTLPYFAVIAQLLLQPGRTYQLLALMVLVFGAVIVRVYRDIHRSIVGTLGAHLRHANLLERAEESEARLRDAIQSFPEGIAVWDEQDRLLVCNDVYARVYGGGRDASQLAGVPYREIAERAFEVERVPAELAGRRDEWIERRLRLHQEGRGELHQYETRDGLWRQGKSVRMRRGGAVGTFADVSGLKQAQDAYRRVLAEEDMVLDTLPVGVAFVGNHFILRCNRRLEQMLGYAPGELHGQSTRVWFGSDDRWNAARQETYARLAGVGLMEGDVRMKRKDGARLWCRVLARALDPASPAASTIIFTFADVEQRVAAEQALGASESMYRNLVETSNDLIWSIDLEGRWSFLNAAAVRRIYGYEPAELLGRPFADLLAPQVRDRDLAVFRRVRDGESVFDYETRHLRRDGGHVDLSFNAIPLRDAAGVVIGTTGTARDVTEQKRAAAVLHETVEKLRLAVDAADLYYWEWDASTDQVVWGRDPRLLFGSPDVEARKWTDYQLLVHPDDRDRYLAAGRAAERGEPYACEFRVAGRDGRMAWILARGKSLLDAAGRRARMIGVSQDITERKRTEEEVRFLAYHDSLTGLPNRRLLDDRLKQSLYLAQRRDAKVAAMIVDLDEFKRVNDTLGHRAGDAVLREVAQRLAGCVRKADTLARHGGDEFVVVIPDLQLEADCQVVAEKILRALEAEILVDGRAFRLGASIGISIFPADAGDGEALLRNADAAMYRAKQLGRNHYRFYGR